MNEKYSGLLSVPDLLNGLPMPILITDLNMNIQMVNKAALILFGLEGELETLIGQPCCVFHAPICGTNNCSIKRLIQTGISVNSFCMNGQTFRVSTVERFKSSGETCGYIEVLQDITEIADTQKRLEETIRQMQDTERELSISEERYRIASENTRDIIVDYDFQSQVMFHTIQATEIYGVPQQLPNAPENLTKMGVITDRSAADFLAMFQKMKEGQQKVCCDMLTCTADGKQIWNRINFTAIFDEQCQPIRAIGIIQNITREKEAELRYEREARYRNLTMQDKDLYYEADITNGRFIIGHEKVFGFLKEPCDDYQILFPILQEHFVFPEDRELVSSKISLQALRTAYQNNECKIFFQYRRMLPEDGSVYWVECTCYFFKDNESECTRIISYVRDISTTKAIELDLRQRAERDLLTGLYNKITTEELISQFLDTSQFKCATGAFLLIDLDNFKSVNDTFGHDAGDFVLAETARRLRESITRDDIAGRLGGDEFVVFLTNADSVEKVHDMATLIGKKLQKTYPGWNGGCQISASVGVSLFPEHGATFHQLYRCADRALYKAKDDGKNTYEVF